jgi:2-polyprenyl-6-methoxyphenol hydroxylase-like FAD-dependent oxidoreductase
MEAPVLIVGAGPVGLTLALELTRRGITPRIIDRSPDPSPNSRALVVHCRTQELLDQAGLREVIASNAIEIRGMTLRRAGRRLATIPFDLGRYPALSLPQQETERLLAAELARRGVSVERGVELTSFTEHANGVEAIVNGDKVSAAFVAGCDGAHSTVRHLLNVPFVGEALPETLWMADASVDWDLEPDRVWQLLHAQGPMSAIPMPGGQWRLVVLRAEDQGEPSAEFFRTAIAERMGVSQPPLDVRWMSVFRVNCRLAATYGRGRVLLSGDAAHIHSPIGGQGMNVGMQDAFSLAAKLAESLAGSGSDVLGRYEAERRPVAAAVIKTNARVTRLSMRHGAVPRLVRDHLMPRILSLPPVSRRVGRAASGLSPVNGSKPQ